MWLVLCKCSHVESSVKDQQQLCLANHKKKVDLFYLKRTKKSIFIAFSKKYETK